MISSQSVNMCYVNSVTALCLNFDDIIYHQPEVQCHLTRKKQRSEFVFFFQNSDYNLSLSFSPSFSFSSSDCPDPTACLSFCQQQFCLQKIVMKKLSVIEDVEINLKNQGPVLTFSNLQYCVQERKFCRKHGPEKSILKDVR